MKAVGLKALKNRLSEYVRLFTSGATVLVTDRDRVVPEGPPPRLPVARLKHLLKELDQDRQDR